jgi:hypothetical protein
MNITLKREVLHRPHARVPVSWIYSYATPVDITWTHADGESAQGPRAGAYVTHGTSLIELRLMLRRQFGKTTTFTEPWKAAKSS